MKEVKTNNIKIYKIKIEMLKQLLVVKINSSGGGFSLNIF